MRPEGTSPDESSNAATAGLATGTDRAPADPAAIPGPELRRLYDDYRTRQARALLGLLPRRAVRPLYARARGAGVHAPEAGDPMAVLVEFCETLLPLPTFEVWLDDLRRYPDAHWRDVDASADAPTPTTPATIDTRRFRRGAVVWNAHLRGFRDRGAWRGFIAFEEPDRAPRRLHRTALIFREESLEELRDRFHGFQTASLEAFLRSSLP